MERDKLVLVIDDDADFLDYVSIILTSDGYDVRTAATAHDGLQQMRACVPSLVIADVMMSYVLDGWSIHQAMLEDEQLCQIPIMMVSAIVSMEDDDLFPASTRNKIGAFMSKPLNPKELLATVHRLTCASQGG